MDLGRDSAIPEREDINDTLPPSQDDKHHDDSSTSGKSKKYRTFPSQKQLGTKRTPGAKKNIRDCQLKLRGKVERSVRSQISGLRSNSRNVKDVLANTKKTVSNVQDISCDLSGDIEQQVDDQNKWNPDKAPLFCYGDLVHEYDASFSTASLFAERNLLVFLLQNPGYRRSVQGVFVRVRGPSTEKSYILCRFKGVEVGKPYSLQANLRTAYYLVLQHGRKTDTISIQYCWAHHQTLQKFETYKDGLVQDGCSLPSRDEINRKWKHTSFWTMLILTSIRLKSMRRTWNEFIHNSTVGTWNLNMDKSRTMKPRTMKPLFCVAKLRIPRNWTQTWIISRRIWAKRREWSLRMLRSRGRQSMWMTPMIILVLVRVRIIRPEIIVAVLWLKQTETWPSS